MQKLKATKLWRILAFSPLLVVPLLVVGGIIAANILRHSGEVNAAAGINETINFQGRLLTSEGAVVPDGSYNIEFKIYCGGDGALGTVTDADCSDPTEEDLLWTETRESGNKVLVKNGYFSVYLGSVTAFGSNIDWNQDELYLSINVGGTGTPSYDGEMDPFTRLGSTPYSLNSKQLGGLESSEFVQLAQGVQTDSSTSNPSIYLNKTGATANILQLQRGGTDVFSIGNGGSAAFKTTTDSTTGFQIQDADGGTPVFNVDTTNERIGIGTASPSSSLDIVQSSTSTSAATDSALELTYTDTGNVSTGSDEARGLDVSLTRTGASGGTVISKAVNSLAVGGSGTDENYAFYGNAYGADKNYGFRGGAFLLGTSAVTDSVGVAGLGYTYFSSGATATNMYGLQGAIGIDGGAATVTNAAGLNISTATNGAGGTITNNYGIQVGGQTVGDSNYGVAIGYADTHTLWVNDSSDSTDEAGGIVFGSSEDTNLYRGAADTLKTDDNLLVQTATNAINAFQVQNSSGSELLTVASNINVVYVGDSTADTTAVLLVLDTKNDSGDPTGTDGAMYYNSNSGKFRCYENGSWQNCLGLDSVHLGKTGSASQNIGGADGTITYLSWDSQVNVDSGFTHSTSTNNSRIQVDADGRYEIIANIAFDNTGKNRTTIGAYMRVNGSTNVTRGKGFAYTRGSAYGDGNARFITEYELSAGDYIEIAAIVDDTDKTYTINTLTGECDVIVRRVN